MNKNPLYLTLLFACALTLPPALTPPAAFAGPDPVESAYIKDSVPTDGTWSKITVSRDADKHEAGVYYVPTDITKSAARGTYRKLYLATNLAQPAFSYLHHDANGWQLNWFRKGRPGHDHRPLSDDSIKIDKEIVSRNPYAGIPDDVKQAVLANAPANATPAKLVGAALALKAAKEQAGTKLGPLLIEEFKRRGSAGVEWASGLYAANPGKPVEAGAAVIKGLMSGNDALAQGIADKVNSDPALKELLSKVNAGTVPPVEGAPVGDAKNKLAEKIEAPLEEKIKKKGFAPGDAAPIADAFTKFIWETWEGGKKSFIAKDVREKDSAAKDDLAKLVRPWTEAAVQDLSKRNGVITLYMGLGSEGTPEEKLPEWVKDDEEIKTILTDEGRKKIPDFEKFPENMRSCMAHWSVEEGKEKDLKLGSGCFPVGAEEMRAATPLGGSDREKWTSAFLTEAVGHAGLLLAALQSNPKELAERIRKGSDTESGPPAPAPDPGDRDNRISTEKTMGMEDLFGKFGDSFTGRDGKPKALNNVFRIDGREFALVSRTIPKFVEGPDGKTRQVLTNQIGIYDVSNKYDIVGKRFDLSESGEHKITLPGRKREYVLTIPSDRSAAIGFKPSVLDKGEDGKIKVPGTGSYKPGDGGKWLDHKVVDALPSMDDLFRARTQKALASPHEVTIGGKKYKITGESAGTGNFLYWDAQALAGMQDSKEPWFTQPTMVARASKVGHNGVEKIEPDKTNTIAAGYDGNKWWGLQWVPTSGGQGYYKTVERDAPDPDPVPKPPAKPGETTTDGNQPAATPGNTPPTSEGEAHIASLNLELKKRLPEWNLSFNIQPSGELWIVQNGKGFKLPSMSDMTKVQFMKEGAIVMYPAGEGSIGLLDLAAQPKTGDPLDTSMVIQRKGDAGFEIISGQATGDVFRRLLDGEFATLDGKDTKFAVPDAAGLKAVVAGLQKEYPQVGFVTGKSGAFTLMLENGSGGTTKFIQYDLVYADKKWTAKRNTGGDGDQTDGPRNSLAFGKGGAIDASEFTTGSGAAVDDNRTAVKTVGRAGVYASNDKLKDDKTFPFNDAVYKFAVIENEAAIPEGREQKKAQAYLVEPLLALLLRNHPLAKKGGMIKAEDLAGIDFNQNIAMPADMDFMKNNSGLERMELDFSEAPDEKDKTDGANGIVYLRLDGKRIPGAWVVAYGNKKKAGGS